MAFSLDSKVKDILKNPAAAAILGMVPLMRSSFWGPMAVAIAGGLFCATVLTLLVLPTMYAAWFKVKEMKEE